MGRPRKTPNEVDRGGPIEQLSELDALEVRVAELEQRLAEAGRRALFHAGRGGRAVAPVGPMLADVGRALLFNTETPDGEELEQALDELAAEPTVDTQAELEAAGGIAGTAEVGRLGDNA